MVSGSKKRVVEIADIAEIADLDRSLYNLLYDSLPHLPFSLEQFKPVQVTHYSDSKTLR